MKADLRLSSAGALIFSLISGCQGTVNADANVSGKGAKGEAEADAAINTSAEGQGEMTRSAVASSPASTATTASARAVATNPAADRVLLGARHDLKLRPGKGTASCQCLSVGLGGAHHAAMLWSAVPPDIDESTQLSIALTSDGQACKDEPKKSLGASYWGYRISGNDVVVMVESARGGHPLTSGAVIPKPVGAGQVYVAPTSKKLPYGRALEGTGMCKIGNPGLVRTAPFNQLEVGDNAPPVPSHKASAASSDDETPTTVELPSN